MSDREIETLIELWRNEAVGLLWDTGHEDYMNADQQRAALLQMQMDGINVGKYFVSLLLILNPLILIQSIRLVTESLALQKKIDFKGI